MFYGSRTPAQPLCRFIELFWACSDAPTHPREKILPSGTIELVVNLREDEIRVYDPLHLGHCRRLSGAVVSGAYSRCFVIDPLQHASIVGVHFRPGGAFPFLGISAGDLANTHVDLEALWGRAAVELRERLCEASCLPARFELLRKALTARLNCTPKHHRAVPIALSAFDRIGPTVRVRDVARQVGLSQRRFIQVFAAEVGLTPKMYARIRRFQQAQELVCDSPAPDWARVAVACGYFDQSHLIRDFVEFAGLAPEDYRRQRSEHVLHNHVPQNV
jgi:AraC-like DNA-binding protein